MERRHAHQRSRRNPPRCVGASHLYQYRYHAQVISEFAAWPRPTVASHGLTDGALGDGALLGLWLKTTSPAQNEPSPRNSRPSSPNTPTTIIMKIDTF